MNTKPTFSVHTTATRKNLKPVVPLAISDLDRQARAETYLTMAGWVEAMPNSKSARENRYRQTLLSCIEAELQDLGYDLVEVSK